MNIINFNEKKGFITYKKQKRLYMRYGRCYISW